MVDRLACVSISLAASLAWASACAPIDVTTTHTVQPRPGPALSLGEQVVDTHLEVDWVQVGPRLFVELGEIRVCARTRHVPVTRIERIERKARGFIAWDFAIAGLTGGLGALAFARPQSFSPRLVSSDGRTVVDPTPAYVVGGIFAGISVILLAAGIVNSVKASDETRYANAYRVDLGPEEVCPADATPFGAQEFELTIGDASLVIAGRSDETGRARIELPPSWPADVAVPEGPDIDAMLHVPDRSRTLTIQLRVPWWDGMVDAKAGHADTRDSPPDEIPATDSPPTGFGGAAQ